MNVSQQILALDARYNAYRVPSNPQYRTLYIRRRSQLLRENAKNEIEHSHRKQYFYLRKQILSKQYGTTHASDHSLRSRSTSIHSRLSSFELSFEDNLEGSRSPTRGHRRWHSGGSFGFLPTPPPEQHTPLAHPLKGPVSKGPVPTPNAVASRKMVGNTTLGENYAFAGMYHVFDQHVESVTAIAFAHDDKFRLAFSSTDGTLSVCALVPTPPKVTCTLRGHTDAVTDFDWSLSNDFIVSASLDGTARVWRPSSGDCLRTLIQSNLVPSGVLACRFQPVNNNMISIGNQKGQVQVFNTSTGKSIKGGVVKLSGAVHSLEFDSSGAVLWAGDEKGYITSILFDLATGKLQRAKRIRVVEGHKITSISYRSWISREARDPSLLVNVACNLLYLYRVSDDNVGLQLNKSFTTSHKSLPIRSSFCPLMSFRQGACVVTGSEDMTVYFFDVERTNKPCVNTLLGHSAPVLDVCWNYDESLLASCDTEGTVIVWKREQRKYNL